MDKEKSLDENFIKSLSFLKINKAKQKHIKNKTHKVMIKANFCV